MDFNVIYEKFVDVILNSTLKIIFKKLLFIELSYNVTKEYPQLSAKVIKMFFS